ncbi:MAG: thioredoxin family protein [Rhizobacter sp.]|nr:thioredoxin family protein [Rhizobacter sp.]
MTDHASPLRRGATAPEFSLPGTDGRAWRHADAAGPNGLVLMFICNHCPYVKAAIDRIVREAVALREIGVGAVAINSNDAAAYPDDSFPNMVAFARRHGMDFPYLHDESQALARAYGAACTPEFFGLDRDRVLHYHGRLDSAGRNPADADTRRELFDAMQQLVQTGRAPQDQVASIGCSIKWLRA